MSNKKGKTKAIKMKKLQKQLTALLIVATIMSVLYAAAVVGLILTWINNIVWLKIICIVYLGAGFYALPIIWINYGDKITLSKVVRAVYSDKLYDVKSIAMQLSDTEENIVNNIRKCIDKRYITGLLFDGETLTVNERREQVAQRKCPNCGAPLEKKNGVLTCEYCGFVYHKDE